MKSKSASRGDSAEHQLNEYADGLRTIRQAKSETSRPVSDFRAEFEADNAITPQLLKERAARCKKHIENDTTIDGDTFFDELDGGKDD